MPSETKEQKADAERRMKADRERLLSKYQVEYSKRSGKPYLVITDPATESMPAKDIAISVFAAACICSLAYYCHTFQPSDYAEADGHPEDGFHFQGQQKAFFVDAHMHVTFLVISCLFLPTIFKIRAVMRDRPAFDLQGILVVWNLIASGLSGWAMYYVVPELINMVQTWGVHGSLCRADYCWAHENIGIYVFVYQVTKCLEWLDTTLLALRKKPLQFLHLFHHIVTMVYCWHASVYSSPVDCAGLWFCGMNLVVHFIMYGYYGIMGIQIKPLNAVLRRFSFLITIIQTAQMIMGVYVLGSSILLCDAWERNWHGTIFCAGMYLTYLYLFAKLTVNKFTLSKELSKKTKTK